MTCAISVPRLILAAALLLGPSPAGMAHAASPAPTPHRPATPAASPTAGKPVAAPSATTRAGGDLLAGIPVLDAHRLNSAAAGVAAATMVLDYYLLRGDSRAPLPRMAVVAGFVHQWTGRPACPPV